MIDSHCHLEQKEFDSILDKTIENCKNEGIKAIITCCAHIKDFEKTIEIVKKFPNYVFATAGIHPEYISEIKESEKDEYLEKIKKEKIVGIGEIGLDYFWCKDKDLQRKQRELFLELLEFSKDLKKPVVIHIRGDKSFPDIAFQDAFKILEDIFPEKVLLHLFSAKKFINRVLENNWYISVGPLIANSKTIKKIVRDMPLEKILLETDSPWFGGKDEKGNFLIGTPINIKIPAKEIAEVKKIGFEEVWFQTGKNSNKFYNLGFDM
ncbi:MAG: TatD family hydrolase [Candidatus Aenigmarchaeota archaeon]|nr:TatD family hydrolase [Candidatus Aenigmarchaeota archaeon]